MALKRRLEVPRRAVEAAPASDQGWREWLFRTYAGVWYWLAVMAIDIGLLFELPRAVNVSAGIAFLVVVAVFVLQIAIYVQVWGKGVFRGGEGTE